MKIKLLNDQATIPTHGTPGSAGLDLYASEAGYIGAGQSGIVKTGIAMAIPHGTVGMVCTRSGMAAKNRVFVLNSPGIIDSDYRNEVMVILFNAGDEKFYIKQGDRIAQLVITAAIRNILAVVDELDVTARTGGFGSTGV